MADIRDKKVDSLLATGIAVAKVGLMLIGLLGLSLELFRDNGLLRQLSNKMLDSSLGLFTIPLALLVIYILHRWLSGRTDGQATRRGDLPMYIMMIIGAYFLYRLISTGSLAA